MTLYRAIVTRESGGEACVRYLQDCRDAEVAWRRALEWGCDIPLQLGGDYTVLRLSLATEDGVVLREEVFAAAPVFPYLPGELAAAAVVRYVRGHPGCDTADAMWQCGESAVHEAIRAGLVEDVVERQSGGGWEWVLRLRPATGGDPHGND